MIHLGVNSTLYGQDRELLSVDDVGGVSYFDESGKLIVKDQRLAEVTVSTKFMRKLSRIPGANFQIQYPDLTVTDILSWEVKQAQIDGDYRVLCGDFILELSGTGRIQAVLSSGINGLQNFITCDTLTIDPLVGRIECPNIYWREGNLSRVILYAEGKDLLSDMQMIAPSELHGLMARTYTSGLGVALSNPGIADLISAELRSDSV